MDPALWRADRWFRTAGAVTLGLLALTAALLAAGASAWRPTFVLAHLAALIALAPLGAVLVWRAARQEGGLLPAVRRHRFATALVGLAFVAIAVSLLNFEDGIRWLRRVANLTTVSVVLVLVARYLAWARRPA